MAESNIGAVDPETEAPIEEGVQPDAPSTEAPLSDDEAAEEAEPEVEEPEEEPAPLPDLRRAVIQGDRVANVITATEAFELPGFDLVTVPDDLPVAAGWGFEGEAFVAPEVEPPPIPDEVSAAQAKTALFDAGLYEGVEASLGGSSYAKVRIWWSSAQVWRRDNPYILGMAAELGLDDDQVDALFVAAAAVPT